LIWTNTSYPPNQVQKFVLESRHPLIEYHLLQECHQHKLAIALVTICRFRVVSFKRVAKLSGKYNGHALVLLEHSTVAAKYGIDFGHIVMFVTIRNGDASEEQQLSQSSWTTRSQESSMYFQHP